MNKRPFDTTQLLNSYGHVFCLYGAQGVREPQIGFMRRAQPEIHHGDPFPWVMATCGGMRDLAMTLTPDAGPNVEGYMGRPPTGLEVANHHLKTKLGLTLKSAPPRFTGWQEITHPYYYGEKTPDVRNVGTVFRLVWWMEEDDKQFMLRTLRERNTTAKPEHVNELNFLTEAQFENDLLGGNHSVKEGEIDFIRALYNGLNHGGVPGNMVSFVTP